MILSQNIFVDKEVFFQKTAINKNYSISEYLWKNFSENLWCDFMEKNEINENKIRAVERERNEMVQILAHEKKECLDLKQMLIEQAQKKSDFGSDELQSYKEQVYRF